MIEVSQLCKSYGGFAAVSDVSFTIEKGHIYGFLGPNGAGKSTTMNIITGCLAASSGEVKIGGFDIFEEPREAKRLIGYLPEQPPLYQEQTVREYLSFVANAKGLRRAAAAAAVEQCAEEAKVSEVLDRVIAHLSKGYRQRVGIAQALIGDPQVVILDEPTVGLDPEQMIEIRDLIRELGKTRTVILSSHILSEIQAVCDRVLIINHGRLVAFDNVENLSRRLSAGCTLEVCVEGDEAEALAVAGALERVQSVTVKERAEDNTTLCLSFGDMEPKEASREVSRAFAAAGMVILQLSAVRASLEDVFLELTREDAPAAEPATETAGAEETAAQPAEEAVEDRDGEAKV